MVVGKTAITRKWQKEVLNAKNTLNKLKVMAGKRKQQQRNHRAVIFSER